MKNTETTHNKFDYILEKAANLHFLERLQKFLKTIRHSYQ